MKSCKLNKLLERLTLAHELNEFWIGCFTLVETVFIFFKEILQSAATLLRENLIDFSLSNAVLVTTVSMNKGGFITVQ